MTLKISKRYIRKLSYIFLLFTINVVIMAAGCKTEEEFFLEETAPVANEEQEKEEADFDTSENEASETIAPDEIYVDVCGAVRKPGVYKLAPESRVYEAVEAAGGFLPEAAEYFVNRAQHLSDGQQLYIPTREETENKSQINSAFSIQAEEASELININLADKEQLMSLPGIGEAKAEAIIKYREENGMFSSIEDIMSVPGVKESVFSKIKDNIDIK